MENGQWISTNASRYKELAAGIDSLGRNISLTDEEFKEYNSLANEISDMFPELVTGYTETGTATIAQTTVKATIRTDMISEAGNVVNTIITIFLNKRMNKTTVMQNLTGYRRGRTLEMTPDSSKGKVLV